MTLGDLLDGAVTGGRVLVVTKVHAVKDGSGGYAFAHVGDLAVEVVRDGSPNTPGLGELLGYSYLTGQAIALTSVGEDMAAPDRFEEVSVGMSTIAAACDKQHEAGREYGLSVVRTVRQVKYSGVRVVAMRYRTHCEIDRVFSALSMIWYAGPHYEANYKGPHPLIDVFGILFGPGENDFQHFSFQSTGQEEVVTPFQTFLVFRAIERAVSDDRDPDVITLPKIPVGGLPRREGARG